MLKHISLLDLDGKKREFWSSQSILSFLRLCGCITSYRALPCLCTVRGAHASISEAKSSLKKGATKACLVLNVSCLHAAVSPVTFIPRNTSVSPVLSSNLCYSRVFCTAALAVACLGLLARWSCCASWLVPGQRSPSSHCCPFCKEKYYLVPMSCGADMAPLGNQIKGFQLRCILLTGSWGFSEVQKQERAFEECFDLKN